jgi:hypothetical protein
MITKSKLNEVSNFCKSRLDELAKKEALLQAKIKNGNTAEIQIVLAQLNIEKAAVNLSLNEAYLAAKSQRNETLLSDARLAMQNALLGLEGIIGKQVDAAFDEYADRLTALTFMSPKTRYDLVRKIGLTMQRLNDSSGKDSRYVWALLDLEARCAAITKNIVDLKQAMQVMKQHNADYEVTNLHFTLIEQVFDNIANQYWKKYELTTKNPSDIMLAVNFLQVQRRLFVLLNRPDEANTLKRKIDAWLAKADSDKRNGK